MRERLFNKIMWVYKYIKPNIPNIILSVVSYIKHIHHHHHSLDIFNRQEDPNVDVTLTLFHNSLSTAAISNSCTMNTCPLFEIVPSIFALASSPMSNFNGVLHNNLAPTIVPCNVPNICIFIRLTVTRWGCWCLTKLSTLFVFCFFFFCSFNSITFN